MARHSAAEQAAASLAIAAPELVPPAELTPEEVATWREITAAFPASWFDGANGPLLAELCRHIALSNHLAEELRAMRHAKLNAATRRGGQVREAYAQLLSMHRAQSQAIMQLSTKLRLTNSSHRRDERYDDRRRLALPSGRVPWERQ
jgi:hypothetical protein